jgi:hypothetical protein
MNHDFENLGRDRVRLLYEVGHFAEEDRQAKQRQAEQAKRWKDAGKTLRRKRRDAIRLPLEIDMAPDRQRQHRRGARQGSPHE